MCGVGRDNSFQDNALFIYPWKQKTSSFLLLGVYIDKYLYMGGLFYLITFYIIVKWTLIMNILPEFNFKDRKYGKNGKMKITS